MGITQFVKRKIAERKEVSKVKALAQKEERQRLQHLRAQRKLEEHKLRIETAKARGRAAAIPKSVRAKMKAKEIKEKLSPTAKRAFEFGKVAGLKFLQDVFKEQKKRRKAHTKRRKARKSRR